MTDRPDSAMPAVSDRAVPKPERHRFVVAARQIFAAGLVLHVVFIPLFMALGVVEMFYINFLSVAAFSACLWLSVHHRFSLALWLAYLEVNAHAMLAVIFIGWGSGFQLYLLSVGPVLLLNPQWSLRLKIPTAFFTALLIIWTRQYALAHAPVYVLPPHIVSLLDTANMVTIFVVLGYLAFFYNKAADDSERRLRDMAASLEQMATTDPLTKLLNRRAIEYDIASEISRYNRTHEAFVLVIGDIDDFKTFNDRYGHDAGDAILEQLARAMIHYFRRHDRISRWGGEEFLIMLPDTTAAQAEQALEKFRAEIGARPFMIGDTPMSITMTFGLAQFRAPMTMDDCIKAADRALYKGKESGKNRVVRAD